MLIFTSSAGSCSTALLAFKITYCVPHVMQNTTTDITAKFHASTTRLLKVMGKKCFFIRGLGDQYLPYGLDSPLYEYVYE